MAKLLVALFSVGGLLEAIVVCIPAATSVLVVGENQIEELVCRGTGPGRIFPEWSIDGQKIADYDNRTEVKELGFEEKLDLTEDNIALSKLRINGAVVKNNTIVCCRNGENVTLSVTVITEGKPRQ